MGGFADGVAVQRGWSKGWLTHRTINYEFREGAFVLGRIPDESMPLDRITDPMHSLHHHVILDGFSIAKFFSLRKRDWPGGKWEKLVDAIRYYKDRSSTVQ